jgi:hypothetical protein
MTLVQFTTLPPGENARDSCQNSTYLGSLGYATKKNIVSFYCLKAQGDKTGTIFTTDTCNVVNCSVRPLTLNSHNISGELYFMLPVTCAVKTLISISQNRINQVTSNRNETENQLK